MAAKKAAGRPAGAALRSHNGASELLRLCDVADGALSVEVEGVLNLVPTIDRAGRGRGAARCSILGGLGVPVVLEYVPYKLDAERLWSLAGGWNSHVVICRSGESAPLDDSAAVRGSKWDIVFLRP